MTRSSSRQAAALLSLFIAAVIAGCGTLRGDTDAAAVDAARAAARQVHEATSAPALAVAVVVDDRIVFQEAFGVADRNAQTPATPRTAFRIGSVSKLLTSSVLLRLLERGVVRLEDPVARYVPEFPHPAVTIGHLAHHLGGVRHYRRAEYMNSTHYESIASALGKFIGDPLVSQPGEKYLYSSYGYNLLGAALERASGVSFQQLVEREVLRPWKMRSTGVAAPAATPLVKFYGRTDAGEVTDAPSIDLSDRIPSGAYVSTAEDLARFLAGIMRLPDSSRELLFRPGVTSGGAGTGVGLGWRVAQDSAGNLYVHHGGESIGGRAFVLLYPDQRVGVVLLANLSFAPFGEKEAQRIAAPFLQVR